MDSHKFTVPAIATICATIFISLFAGPGAFAFDGANDCLDKGQTVVTTEGSKHEHFVRAKVLIHAKPAVVWEIVHRERQQDPDIAYSKILKKENNDSTLEQKFCLLPVLGTAVCIMLDQEIPMQKISFKLLKSDHFKAMEGSWVFTAADNGNACLLELTSHLELGFPVPQSFMDSITGKKLDKRLQHIREMSETAERVAHATTQS